jgi:hypothetical protein
MDVWKRQEMERSEEDRPSPVGASFVRGVSEAAVKALQDGKTHYTDGRGLFELRAVAHYDRQYRVKVSRTDHCRLRDLSAMFMVFSALLERVRGHYIDPIMPVINFIRFPGKR